MSEPYAFEELLLRGVAQTLVANPNSRVPLAWDDESDPNYVYPDDAVGIYFDTRPLIDGGSITLTEYTVSDDVSLSDSVEGVQLVIQHRDRSVVKLITSDVFNLLHGRERSMLGDVTLVSATRSSGTNMGQDANERQGRIENYYLTVHRPSPNRL